MKTWKETAIELNRELDVLRQTVERWPELDRLRQLRDAVAWWPERSHDQSCPIHVGGWCNCGAGPSNEARRLARELVGLNRDG